MKRNCRNCVDIIEIGGLEPCKSCLAAPQPIPNFRPREEEPMPSSDKKIEVFFDSDKGKMPELKPPTTEMVIAAGKDLEDCPEVKRALEKLYPAAFDKSVKMVGDIENENGDTIAWVSDNRKSIVFSSCYNWKSDKETSELATRTTPTRK